MKLPKNTKQWVRVFFVLALVSLIGILWQWQNKLSSLVKVSGGSFTEGIIGTPRFINPVLAQSQSDKDLTKLIIGSMVTKDTEGKNSFSLADSLTTSQDKKTYTLKLKEGLVFHDNETITIDDVIFTIEKIQDPLIKSPLQNRWEGVKVEKIDNLTVKFTLSQEYSDFENNFNIGILPKHIWEKIKADEFIFSLYNTKPIGSGHYAIKKTIIGKTGIPLSYSLNKTNSSHSYISEINLIFYENEEMLVEAYRKGNIDAAYGLSANETNRDLFNNEYSNTGKLPRVFGLFFNQNKQPLLKEKNIRSLIQSSINKQELIDTVFSGYAYPIDGPFGEIEESKPSNLKRDIEVLEKDGWVKNSNGIYEKKINDALTSLTLDLSIPNIDDLISLANIIKVQLFNQGIQVNIRAFDEANLHQKVIRPREYDILLFGYMLEKNTDLYAFWHSSQKNDPGLNISLYGNNTIDNELENLRKDKSLAKFNIIKKEILNDIPAVFLYSPAFTYILPEKIHGDHFAIIEKQDRFANIENWYIRTRKVWNFFVK